jgi:sodium transport system permease protein
MYPVLGFMLMQLAQLSRPRPVVVAVIGSDLLGKLVGQETEEYFDDQLSVFDQADELQTVSVDWPAGASPSDIQELARRCVAQGRYDAVAIIWPAISGGGLPGSSAGGDQITLSYDHAHDPSRLAAQRFATRLNSLQASWLRQRLSAAFPGDLAATPLRIEHDDLATATRRAAAFWGKLLPFVMLIWALTGAFYPAVDLIAGEKERGTLETLLCAPARRGEIVWGKLLAVATLSAITSLLNLASLYLTAQASSHHFTAYLPGFAPPPLAALGWLTLALLPLALFFSALALAVSALARSSKEGQHYLMPLLVLSMPLVVLPLLPGQELSALTSLIPVSGVLLLVRTLIDGQYMLAISHLPLVVLIMTVSLLLAVQWTRRMFESEAVLFCDAERWEWRHWWRRFWSDGRTEPTAGEAALCGLIILGLLFIVRLTATTVPQQWSGIVLSILVPQLGCVLLPALVMARMTAGRLSRGLSAKPPHWPTLPAAVLLAVTVHPVYTALTHWLELQWPLPPQVAEALQPIVELIRAAPAWQVFLVLALLPAVCEELAFRGYMLNGLSRRGGELRGLILTSIAFGMSHALVQQGLAAILLGFLLGWLARRTSSVWPCVVCHATMNGLSLALSRVATASPSTNWMLQVDGLGVSYQPIWAVLCAGLAVACLLYLSTVTSTKGVREPRLATAA